VAVDGVSHEAHAAPNTLFCGFAAVPNRSAARMRTPFHYGHGNSGFRARVRCRESRYACADYEYALRTHLAFHAVDTA